MKKTDSMHRQQILEILELDERSKCSTHADFSRHLMSGQLKGWHQSYFDDGWVTLNASGTSWAVFEHFGSPRPLLTVLGAGWQKSTLFWAGAPFFIKIGGWCPKWTENDTGALMMSKEAVWAKSGKSDGGRGFC